MKKPVLQDVEVAKCDLIDGLMKGVEVIRAFDGESVQLTATDLAEKVGISRSAARRGAICSPSSISAWPPPTDATSG
jgi:IclR family pca regulon transcriptional regulator